MFEHLRQQGTLVRFIQENLKDFPNNGTIYLVTSLKDAISSTIIDITVLIRRITKQQRIQPRLYLFLSTAEADAAQTFAALRELRRVSTTQHTIELNYGTHRNTPILSGNLEPLFDHIFLYDSEPNASEPALSTIVADTIALHFDQEYGAFLSGRNANVSKSERTHQQAQHTDGFYVGFRQANTLLMPIHDLVEYLTPKYMQSTLNYWLGNTEIRKTISQYANGILKEWAKESIKDIKADDASIICPEYIREAIAYQFEDENNDYIVQRYIKLSAASLINFFEPTSLPAAKGIIQSEQDILHLQPSSKITVPEHESSKSIQSLYDQTQRYLIERFGTIENESPRTGSYNRIIARFVPIILQASIHHIERLCQHILKQPSGLTLLHSTLQNLLQILINYQDSLEQAYEERKQNSYKFIGTMPNLLKQRSRKIKKLRKRRLLSVQLTPEVEDFRETSDKIWQQCIAESILHQQIVLVQQTIAIINEIKDQTNEWMAVFWTSPDNLESQIRNEYYALESNNTRWLIDDTWIQNTFKTFTDSIEFDKELKWIAEFTDQKTSNQWLIKLLPSLENERQLLTRQYVDWSEQNYKILRSFAQNSIIKHLENWTAWRFLFSGEAIYASVAWIAERLQNAPLYLSVQSNISQVWNVDYVVPSLELFDPEQVTEADQISDSLAQAYNLLPRKYQKRPLSDPTRLALMIAGDVIILESLEKFSVWQAAYRAHPNPEYLHNWQLEQRAAILEKHHFRDHQLSNRLIELMQIPLEDFVRSCATDVLKAYISTPIDSMVPNYLDLALAFNSKLNKNELSLSTLQQSIQKEIHTQVKIWRDTQQTEPDSDIWHWVESLRKTNSTFYKDALIEAFEHHLLLALQQKLLQYPVEASRISQDQSDWHIIMLETIKIIAEAKRLTVRDYVNN